MRDAEETLCIVGVVCVQHVTCCDDRYDSDTQMYVKQDCGLTEVPEDIPAQVRMVVLGLNDINHIRDGAFRHLTVCTELYLYWNALTEVRAGMWEGLSSLTKLILYSNQISMIEVGAFNTLTSLEMLWLENNELVTLEEGLFNTPLRTSFELSLYNNPLQCDARMCWIKEVERVGHITWYTWSHDGRPERKNQPGVLWDDITLNCTEPGQS